ncbi:Mur ligase family protein [Arcanobacterium hippocoleae]
MLSGIEIFDGVQRREAHLTTDESVELIRNLARCVENGLTHCVVEVSSQALKYGRVAGIEFDTCSFTNIGYDHISPQEHPDFADYFNAKLRIIEQTKDFIYSAAMEHVSEVIAKSESEKFGHTQFHFPE